MLRTNLSLIKDFKTTSIINIKLQHYNRHNEEESDDNEDYDDDDDDHDHDDVDDELKKLLITLKYNTEAIEYNSSRYKITVTKRSSRKLLYKKLI